MHARAVRGSCDFGERAAHERPCCWRSQTIPASASSRLRDPDRKNRVSKSKVAVLSWLMQMGQLSIQFGQHRPSMWPKWQRDETSNLSASHFRRAALLRVYNRRVPEIPFEWHHHPEYELTLTLNSRGWRFIGDHIGQYQAPDLVLVPSDMPHTWASTATLHSGEPHTAIVIWFSRAWALQVAEVCPGVCEDPQAAAKRLYRACVYNGGGNPGDEAFGGTSG